jgi:hypothetical protein
MAKSQLFGFVYISYTESMDDGIDDASGFPVSAYWCTPLWLDELGKFYL